MSTERRAHLADFRKVEGKQVYIDLIKRKVLTEKQVRDLLPHVDVPPSEMFGRLRMLQISTDAAAFVLWGEQEKPEG